MPEEVVFRSQVSQSHTTSNWLSSSVNVVSLVHSLYSTLTEIANSTCMHVVCIHFTWSMVIQCVKIEENKCSVAICNNMPNI